MSLLPLFGVLLCAFGTVVNTAGMLCIKRASLRESDLPVYKRRFFWLGIVLLLVNSGGISLVVYAITPLGLTAPVNALTVVWGNLFSWRGWITGQREQLNRRVIYANAVIVAGIVLTTTFGPKSGELPSLEAVATHLRSSGAIIYLFCALLAILNSLGKLFFAKFLAEAAESSDDKIVATTIPTRTQSSSESSTELLRGMPLSDEEERTSGGDGAPANDTNDGAPANEVDDDDPPPPSSAPNEDPPTRPPAVDPEVDEHCSGGFTIFLFPLSSALCASLAVVAFKIVSIYLARLVSEGLPPDGWLALALTLAVVLSILNVAILNAGMEQSRASYFVSTYMALTVILTIVGGMIFYGEFEQVKVGGPNVVTGFLVGVLTSVVGISWLSYLQPTEAEKKDEEEHAEDMVDSEVPAADDLSRSVPADDLSTYESADTWEDELPWGESFIRGRPAGLGGSLVGSYLLRGTSRETPPPISTRTT